MRVNRVFVVGAVLLAPWMLGSVRGDDLPADAQKLVDNFDRDAAEIQGRADRLIRERREELVARLRDLRERYAKDGRTAQAEAVRAQIEELTTGGVKAEADPGTLVNFRGQNGKSFYFEVTGNKGAGAVYGTDLYTDDSTLAAAAVHAGVLADGQKGVVKVTILPGAASYTASDRNGVSSAGWNNWDGSYRVQAVGARTAENAAQPDPGNLVNFRGQNHKSFLFEVTGNKAAGSVWGSGPYTDDSSLAAAVVHAGILEDGEKGVVRVTILPGAASYEGSDKNGVASDNWGAWEGSYRIQGVKK